MRDQNLQSKSMSIWRRLTISCRKKANWLSRLVIFLWPLGEYVDLTSCVFMYMLDTDDDRMDAVGLASWVVADDALLPDL